MLLYKYRPWNQFTAEVVTAKRIFFPTKGRLNDPSELVHPVQFEVPTGPDLMSSWLRMQESFDRARSMISPETFLLAMNIGGEIRRLKALARSHKEVATDDELGHYLNIPDEFWRVVEAVFDRAEVHDAIAYYALTLAEDQGNLYDRAESIVQRLNAKLEGLGVLSLSARCDCPVMWAHYSQNHQGVVLVLDSERDQLIGQARKIEYVSARPTDRKSVV